MYLNILNLCLKMLIATSAFFLNWAARKYYYTEDNDPPPPPPLKKSKFSKTQVLG